ncbi:MAG: hypothetical protein C3F06_13040 [Candidatus Methanoperedenaceae archaeon]|nr:MAG: hypothetical protein C3F06_13040 [Candidatus Methanoperedenaceae archaeon]
MCGIFGITIKEDSNINRKQLTSIVNNLFKLSESRGKEAAGIAIHSDNNIKVFKQPTSASEMVRSNQYKKIFEDSIPSNGNYNRPISIIGHSRLVTNGVKQINENNQPIIKDDIVGFHNGIIVNDIDLWKTYPSMNREYEVDTEVILTLIRYFYGNQKSLVGATRNFFKIMKGTASIALLFCEINQLLLASNNGSLYICTNENQNIVVFSSELQILNKLIQKESKLRKVLGKYSIFQIKPGDTFLLNLDTVALKKIGSSEDADVYVSSENDKNVKEIVDVSPINKQIIQSNGNQTLTHENLSNKLIYQPPSKIALKRCTKCILPATMPFIEFDEEGVCNYCRSYKKIEIKDNVSLEKFIEKYRNKTGDPECILTFSGGRDSSYGLHYIENVLKLNSIAYTYDWGMVTDLARRNIARMCGKLGVEHILVSADIIKKRENVRKNVTAWLKNPDLGMIPLFMAGDKQYFYYANKLMEDTGIELVILCENMLENTFFKTGYCGIRPRFGNEHTYSLGVQNKIKLIKYYIGQFVKNPSYINSSLFDTAWAYFSYYLMPHEYLNLYRYVKWDEQEIESTLISEYDWEVATDTKSTWRIGDGTAAFYNYIYYAMTGFTENDTFRSNQIREGIITREEALRLIEEENKPRYEAIKWYCDTIGIDFAETVDTINSIPKLYNI